MPFLVTCYFWVAELFPLVDPNLPMDYKEFTEEQKKLFRDFACTKLEVFAHY
jgi:hypothetical protein